MKIPPQAKKVFSGKIFDTYQWDQKMYDGTTSVFERLKRADTVQIIAEINGRIMLIEDEQPDRGPVWTTPGGRVDEGEEPLSAAKRELLEETGLTSEDWELYMENQPLNKMDWTIYTYIARSCKQVAEPHLDGGEKIIPHLFSFDDFVVKVIDKDFRSQNIPLDILRRAYQGTLDEFKTKLFGN